MQNISELMVQMKNVFKNPQKELLEKEKKANISLSRLREMHLLHFFAITLYVCASTFFIFFYHFH